MKLIYIKVFLITLMIGAILTGCTSGSTYKVNNKLTVYTSFYPIYDFAHKIGGGKVNITNLVPSGTEPHDWEPTARDVANIQESDVFIYNGAGMETWIDTILTSINNKNLLIVETAKGLNNLKNKDLNENLKYDPHVWLDPMNAKKQMEAIKIAFQSKDPLNKDYYEKNYIESAKKLDDLDKEYKETLSKLPKKDIVVAHQAFGYLCNAYGLNQIAIEGLDAEAEPSPSKMAEIVKLVKEKNIKYIFFETLISPKVAETIANEVGAKTAVLNPVEGLSDEEIKAGKEYFSVMKDNLVNLTKALE